MLMFMITLKSCSSSADSTNLVAKAIKIDIISSKFMALGTMGLLVSLTRLNKLANILWRRMGASRYGILNILFGSSRLKMVGITTESIITFMKNVGFLRHQGSIKDFVDDSMDFKPTEDHLAIFRVAKVNNPIAALCMPSPFPATGNGMNGDIHLDHIESLISGHCNPLVVGHTNEIRW